MLSGGPLASLFHEYEFQPHANFVAAVSGGSDSTALLILLKAHLDKRYPGARLIAATVDHGLRLGSRKEAQEVGVFCRARGIEHRILTWTGEKPARGIQAAARLARHRLLADLAKRENAAAVFTGHTRDDQAETVLMRQARADGPGSAGIAPATLFDASIWFVRPLIDAGRAALREMLVGQGVNWIEDPTNSDARFERARLRAALGLAVDAPARIVQALQAASDAAAERVARSRSSACLLRDHARLAAPGLIQLDRGALAGPDNDLRQALRVLVAVAGGAQHLPDMDSADVLLKKLREGSLRANMARALVDGRKDAIYFLRENRGVPLESVHQGAIWDGRYRIVAAGQTARVDSSRSVSAPESLVRMAANAEPVLASGCAGLPVLGPWRAFLPIFDVALASAAAGLIGADKFPVLPRRSKIATTT